MIRHQKTKRTVWINTFIFYERKISVMSATLEMVGAWTPPEEPYHRTKRSYVTCMEGVILSSCTIFQLTRSCGHEIKCLYIITFVKRTFLFVPGSLASTDAAWLQCSPTINLLHDFACKRLDVTCLVPAADARYRQQETASTSGGRCRRRWSSMY